MKHVWYIHGPKAGTFETLIDDAEAERLAADDVLQILDGKEELRYPENHPHYGKDVPTRVVKKRQTRKKKYPNKMLVSDSE